MFLSSRTLLQFAGHLYQSTIFPVYIMTVVCIPTQSWLAEELFFFIGQRPLCQFPIDWLSNLKGVVAHAIISVYSFQMNMLILLFPPPISTMDELGEGKRIYTL